DVDGNWSVGALASLLDVIGIATIYSFASRIISTEHVEIKSKVSAKRGMLMHVVVEVRREGNGEVIAVGKLWTASNKLTFAQ
ncbi:hypothetical protein Goari_025545, partial [Gossypium aridum]|nr:hypothetical protein [Gossypium aridum]